MLPLKTKCQQCRNRNNKINEYVKEVERKTLKYKKKVQENINIYTTK